MNDKKMRTMKYLMLLVNFTIVYYLALIIYTVTNKLCISYESRSFLDRVDALPKNPLELMITIAILLVVLVVDFLLREYRFFQNKKIIYALLLLDVCVSIGIIILLDFNYNGIVLLVFANVIYYVEDKSKYIYLVLAILFFVGTDFQLISINYDLFSLTDYLQFYDESNQQQLTAFFNLLVSANIMLFIMFCIFVIQEQKGIIDEVNFLYKKLSDTNKELETAVEELKTVADIKEEMGKTKERNRLAREIHDTLGHSLTGISVGIDACIAIIDLEPKKTKEQLQMLASVTRSGIQDIRRSVNELRPDALEQQLLFNAIKKMLSEFKTITNAEINFQHNITGMRFSEDEENTVFRIIQESVTNSVRHGRAKKVNVSAFFESDNIEVRILDDGMGCMTIKKGFGTTHMKERVQMLGGTICFKSEYGFEVIALIPIRWREEDD